MNEQPATAPASPVEDVTGSRITAALIDIAILFGVFLIVAVLFGDTTGDDGDSGFSVNLSGLPALVYFLIVMGYYFALESFNGGQTVGKKIMSIKVVAMDGALTPGKVIIRSLLRIIDGLPVFYLLGLIVVAVSQRKQRIGDMAAGTLVVRA